MDWRGRIAICDVPHGGDGLRNRRAQAHLTRSKRRAKNLVPFDESAEAGHLKDEALFGHTQVGRRELCHLLEIGPDISRPHQLAAH